MATKIDIQPLYKVAEKIKDLAIRRVPIDSGNLRNSIIAANTPQKMLKQSKDFTFEFTLNYAGRGFEYGKYWNKPYGYPPHTGTTQTIRKRYPQHFDFATDAMNDVDLDKEILAYLNNIGDYLFEIAYED